MRRSAIGWVVFNDSPERNQFDGETKRWMKYDLLRQRDSGGGFVSHPRIINKILPARIAVKCFLV